MVRNIKYGNCVKKQVESGTGSKPAIPILSCSLSKPNRPKGLSVMKNSDRWYESFYIDSRFAEPGAAEAA